MDDPKRVEFVQRLAELGHNAGRLHLHRASLAEKKRKCIALYVFLQNENTPVFFINSLNMRKMGTIQSLHFLIHFPISQKLTIDISFLRYSVLCDVDGSALTGF